MAIHPEEELLSELIDGEAKPEDELMLRSHLEACDSCRERMRSLLDVSEALAPLRAATPPPSLKRSFLREWESRWGRLNARRIVGSLTLAGAPVLAGGVLLALLAPQFAFRPDPPSRSGAESVSPVAAASPNRKANAVENPRLATLFVPLAPDGFESLERETPEKPSESLPPRKGRRSTERARRGSLDARRVGVRVRRRSDPRPAIAEASLASAKTSGEDSKKPIFKLTVEEVPNYEPPLPKRSICSWSARNDETGDVDQGSIIRRFDSDGDLKSVDVNLTLDGETRPVPAPADGDPRSSDSVSPAPDASDGDPRASRSERLDDATPLNPKETKYETLDDRLCGPRSLCLDRDGSQLDRLPSV